MIFYVKKKYKVDVQNLIIWWCLGLNIVLTSTLLLILNGISEHREQFFVFSNCCWFKQLMPEPDWNVDFTLILGTYL